MLMLVYKVFLVPDYILLHRQAEIAEGNDDCTAAMREINRIVSDLAIPVSCTIEVIVWCIAGCSLPFFLNHPPTQAVVLIGQEKGVCILLQTTHPYIILIYHWYLFFIHHVRFVQGDETWLSPNYKWDSCHITEMIYSPSVEELSWLSWKIWTLFMMLWGNLLAACTMKNTSSSLYMTSKHCTQNFLILVK